MKIDMTDGLPTVDAADLGKLLELSPKEVQAKMRAGEITSRLETGIGEDAGKLRLTFFHAGCRVRLTCREDGTVITTSRIQTGGN